MTENTDTSPSPPNERKIPPWSKGSPVKEMEVEVAGKGHTIAGDSGRDDESTTTTTDGTMSYFYTTNSGKAEGDSTKNHDDSKRRREGEGGSAGETSTAENSECSSSRGGEDGTSEGSQPSFLSRLTGKVMPAKGKGDSNTGNRLVSRFWKQMPKEGEFVYQ